MSFQIHTPTRKDAVARALLLVFAFSSWSLTAPANIALALLSILWLTEVPHYWRQLSREPAVRLSAFTLLIGLLLAWRATLHFPVTAHEQLHGLGGWMAPFLFIVPAWWLRRDPKQIMPMLVAAFLGLIFGVVHKTDWSLAPHILHGMRYHFGSAALGLSFITSVALTGLLIFRGRIITLPINGRPWPAIGWTLWGLGCGLLLAILVVTQSRGAALALAIAAVFYGLLNWRSNHPKTAGPRGLPDSRFLTLLAMLLCGLFLFWSFQDRNIEDWRELTNPGESSAKSAMGTPPDSGATGSGQELSYVSSTAVRLNLIEVGLAAFVQRPWLGFGPGTSTTEFLVPQRIIPVSPYHLLNAPNWSHLHSVPLEILARFGLVGILIALLLGRLVWRAYRRLWGDPRASLDLRIFLTLSGILLLFYCAYDFRLLHVDIRFFFIQWLGIVYSFALSELTSPELPDPSSGWRRSRVLSACRPPAGDCPTDLPLSTASRIQEGQGRRDQPPRLGIYCGPMDGGSTAKIAIRLANGFAARGFPADLLVSHCRAPVIETTAPGVEVIEMGRMRPLRRVLAMARYLNDRQPVAVLTHRIREDVFTLKATRWSRTATAIFVTVHGPLSLKLRHMPPVKAFRRRSEILRYYPRNQGIIAITDETATDLRMLLGPAARVCTIPNPIISQEMIALAQAPLAHPWFADRADQAAIPIILFAGRLEREKDLPTLLRAFDVLRQQHPCRLLIIGEGSLRPELEAQRRSLSLDELVSMPGWAPNPYPYLRRASLVVVSSTQDALPTVLIEALALGTPVVSTDCGPGPREILANGRFGPLVPPRDAIALAQAMAKTLADPLPPASLHKGGEPYSAQRNADLYLEFMLGRPVPAGQED